jgi:type II secretory pathway predicted ATPase ExeA
MAGSQRDYLCWLLEASAADQRAAETILTREAIDLLAGKLRTPLRIQRHLSLALEASYQVGERPVSAEMVESVFVRGSTLPKVNCPDFGLRPRGFL